MITQRTLRFWTFTSLVGAFFDLFVAYFLLCGSTIAFFAFQFLAFFGLSFPTPNNGYQFRSLLVDYPTDKISAVQYSVTRKFPFDSIFFKIHQNCHPNDGFNLDRGDINASRFTELEGEASCSSKSDARKLLKNEFDDAELRIEKEKEKEKGFDMKGKGAVNNRVRGGFRRRRKASLDTGKHSSFSSSLNWITCVDQDSNDKELNGGLEASSIFNGVNDSNYEVETPMSVNPESNYHEDIAFNEQVNRNEALETLAINDDDKYNTIVLLTRELEQEQAARAALYIELEKERNAAATAADEAMAMILRLQEEKASIEMESRQYQRMIEEKSAYDAEEMNILKEIVLRREREKHFLEKEVETYRQMLGLENDQLSGETEDIHVFNEDPDQMLQQLSMSIAKRRNSSEKEETNKHSQEKTIAIVKEEQKPSGEKELHVYDVHVIDQSEKSNGNEGEGSFLRKLDKEANETLTQSVSEMSSGLPPLSSSSKYSLRRNSTSALDNERTKLDTEVEWLRERLRIVQEGREKLNFSIDNREKENLQLQLLEDIARQLQEIRMLTEPRKSRQASLPLQSAKSSTKKRRCRSVSSGPAKSS